MSIYVELNIWQTFPCLHATFLQTAANFIKLFFISLDQNYTYACLLVAYFISVFFFWRLCLCGYHVMIAIVSSVFVSMYLHLFMFLWVDIQKLISLYIVQYFLFIMYCYLIGYLSIHVQLCIYFYTSTFVLIMGNICLLFALFFVCLHVDHVTNALLYLYLFLCT